MDEPPAARNPLDLRPADGDAGDEARATLSAIFAGVGMEADARRLARLPEDLRKNGGEWWVCSMRDVVVGAVGIRATGPGQGELCWWGVVPARRGMGIGRWMAEHAVAHARRRLGLTRVRATVEPTMRRAAKVLLDLGFRGPEGFDPETFDHAAELTLG